MDQDEILTGGKLVYVIIKLYFQNLDLKDSFKQLLEVERYVVLRN
jgi:hypothetical protein